MLSIVNKSLLRLAVAIHAELASHGSRERNIELPRWSWERCQELAGMIRRAEQRGWHLAAEELRRDLAYTIPSVQAELTAIVAELPRVTTIRTTASAGDIYSDLLALADEFNEVDFDLRGRRLSVTTEPITLQNIYLGPFEIRLDWGRIGSDSAYRILANEPHPSGSRESVTHPHVLDEILCEGHSRQAIRQALTQGRLLDFFTLVANGLRTYNEESPFVALELWFGATCSDCGAVVDEDERYACQKCEETICDRCEASCCGCDESCCSQCITVCEACDDNFCRGCLRPCKGCRRNTCSGCLDENERCTNCHEKEERDEDTEPAANRAAIQPHCVGQALVPA